jgi:hypothetical protein
MKLVFHGLGLAALLSLPLASSAGDCTKFFDQSCLASGYNRQQVERDRDTKEARALAEVKAHEEKAEKEAMTVRNEDREYKRAQRHEVNKPTQAPHGDLLWRSPTYQERVKAINGDNY